MRVSSAGNQPAHTFSLQAIEHHSWRGQLLADFVVEFLRDNMPLLLLDWSTCRESRRNSVLAKANSCVRSATRCSSSSCARRSASCACHCAVTSRPSAT